MTKVALTESGRSKHYNIETKLFQSVDMTARTCKECGHDFPIRNTSCVHCGRPQLFPNVDEANTPEERAALDLRYEAARKAAQSRGAGTVLQSFEATMPRAVLSCPLQRIEALIHGENDLYATFHHRRQLRASIPSVGTVDWDELRLLTERKLFGDNKKYVHYAVLSLSDVGDRSYGTCHIFFKESMIAHRASVFEKNSVVFMRDKKVTIWGGLPRGYRTVWANRMRLAVAKLADKITPTTNDTDFAVILLNPGTTPADGDFIEVHIFGTITLRTLERIIIEPGKSRRDLKIKVLRERCRAVGVELIICP